MLLAKGSELELLGWGLGVEFGDVGECEQWVSPSLCPHHPHGCGRLPGTSPHLLLCVPDIGWWFCQMKTKRGWVPASYLEPLDSPDEAEDPDPNYAGAPCPLRQCGVWERKWVRGHEEASSSSVIFSLEA